MNQYKQEYVTEFAYILGTMQKEYGNVIDKFPPRITENQDGIKIFNEFVEFMVDKFLSSTSRDYEDFIRTNIDDIKNEFVNTERENKWKNIHSIELAEYEELTPIQKNHLADFSILNSIDSCMDQVNLETKEKLLNIIRDVWLKDEEHISESKVADEIVEAYRDKKVTLTALENANNRDILQCVYGYQDFRTLNKYAMEEFEYIENLFENVSKTEYFNEESNVIIVEHGIIVGQTKAMILYLMEENDYMKKTNGVNENFDEAIKNNENLIEELRGNISQNILIGIEWNKTEQSYNLMENEEIIERLEDIIEDQEEEYEEEY